MIKEASIFYRLLALYNKNASVQTYLSSRWHLSFMTYKNCLLAFVLTAIRMNFHLRFHFSLIC